MAQAPKKLQRSRRDHVIAGVCGGIAEYFGLDSTIVRVVFAILIVLWGSGILLYLALWIIVPLTGKEEAAPSLGQRVRQTAEEMKAAAEGIKKEFKKKR